MRLIALILFVGLTLFGGSAVARDYLYNSGFVVIQYGPGPWTIGSAAYTADRWAVKRSTSGATLTRLASTNDTGARFKMKVQRTAGDTHTEAIAFYEALDTTRSLELAGRQITFSFYGVAGANYSPTSGALVSRVTFGTGCDQASSGAPDATWTGASTDDVSHTLTGTQTRFSHTVTVPQGATQVGFSFIASPTGTAGANDYFVVEAPKVELGSTATPYEGQSDSAAYDECALFYEDMARHPFTGYKHLRVITYAFASGHYDGYQYFQATVRHKTKRDFNHTLSIGPANSWHVTTIAGTSYWGLVAYGWSHQTVSDSLLTMYYAIDGTNPALPDGYPALLALDGGSYSTKFAISQELAP